MYSKDVLNRKRITIHDKTIWNGCVTSFLLLFCVLLLSHLAYEVFFLIEFTRKINMSVIIVATLTTFFSSWVCVRESNNKDTWDSLTLGHSCLAVSWRHQYLFFFSLSIHVMRYAFSPIEKKWNRQLNGWE